MTEQTTGTALALPEPTALATMFRADGGLDPIIARIEAEARSHAPDLTTAKGRKAIAKLAYKIAQSKSALDEAGKALNEEARRQINAVDAERRKARDRLDALKDEIRAPLTKWEADEDARVEALKERLKRLETASPNEDTAADYRALIARVDDVAIDETWQEFKDDAARAKSATLARLRLGLEAAATREAQEAELARLRAEAAAREEEDRKRREAEAEAERQRVAAEEAERARIAAAKAEAERLARIEREKQEAAARAAREAEERAAAEAARIQREAEEREAALKRAAADAEDRHRRELEEAKRREEAAAQAERDRIEAQRRADEAARQKREADAAHRTRIRDDIATSMTGFTDETTALLIACAILDGAIPHVKAVL